jgi:hypothetical protein
MTIIANARRQLCWFYAGVRGLHWHYDSESISPLGPEEQTSQIHPTTVGFCFMCDQPLGGLRLPGRTEYVVNRQL